ncbi:hypothetical protein ACMD2_14510 [Ananas comosus]|uniref:Localized to the inner membrane of the chloroplast n=1 Tax=Ananas comosus TaxID=4615 RepID=A0A199W803_ANACO|nr:hypothetical protein ACMD2_14510 [Ananas comosus]
MAALASFLFVPANQRLDSLPRGIGKQLKQPVIILSPSGVSYHSVRHPNSKIAISRSRNVFCASFREGGRPSSASIFVGGFILGGIIVGALGCVYAPQISKALAGADRKDLMRKLPKFLYDEEKALEKTRKVLTEKIAQLNAAIDDVSSQLRADDAPNGAAVTSDEIEAAA